MPNYIEEKKDIEVPPATGIPGLLRAISSVLELKRVQRVVVEVGRISYTRFRREDEPELPAAELDLSTLMPAAVIRNSELEELRLLADNAAVGIAQLFSKAHMDGMNPIALVGSPSSLFFAWHVKTTGVVLAKTECYGLPFLADPDLSDEALVLCTAYSRRATLPDTVRCYKLTVPLLRKAKS